MIIAHDLGTSGNKASLHEDDGRLLDSVTVSYPTDYRHGGIAEQDPRDWERAVIDATRRLVRQAGVQASRVSGLVVSGQMMGAVLLDHRYEPVRPAIIWADTRAHAQAERLSDLVGAARAYEILGHRVDPTYSLAKLMWIREHEPESWARSRHVCIAKDFVVHRLTGVLATDRSDASSTNAYDQAAGTWSSPILEAAGVDESLFPPILESTQVVGAVRDDVAEEMGLPRGVHVVMGGGDGPTAAVGAGRVSPDTAPYVCLGTSSWISFASASPLHDERQRTFTFDHVVPGLFVPTATMQSSGASIDWAYEVLSADGGSPPLPELISAAGADDVDTGNLYFLPYLLGERSPHWAPDARGAFLGIERHHHREHMMRAVLEGIGFNLALCLEAFAQSGRTIESIDAIGGGAASDQWLQILADIWCIPVHRRSVVEEANSLGAAVTAAVGLGLTDFDAARDLSHVVADFSPDPRRSEIYAERLPRFRDAFSALSRWFHSTREA